MPGPCTRSDSDQYVAHHNPALYFTGLRGSCRSRDLPMGNGDTAAFNAALGAGRAGDFNLVVPNNCDNGHDPCGGDPVRHFDDFLAREVPRIQSSPSFGPRGVIVVVWDEGADAPHDPGHVAAAVLGPLVRPGVVDRTRHNHYSLERMLADGFRVAPLARARQASPISGIWR
jgi:hypothetical protein